MGQHSAGMRRNILFWQLRWKVGIHELLEIFQGREPQGQAEPRPKSILGIERVPFWFFEGSPTPEEGNKGLLMVLGAHESRTS